MSKSQTVGFTPARRKMRSNQEKISIINRQQTSGLTVAAYCKKQGVHLTQYYSWKKKLAFQKHVPSKNDFIQLSHAPDALKLEILLPNGILVRSSTLVEASYIQPLMRL